VLRLLQLVTLPYNLLLSKAARDSLGIDLTNQVVIIDEAHSRIKFSLPNITANPWRTDLVSTLLSLSSATLNVSTLIVSISQLDAYISKFRLRLSHKHLLHLRRLKVTLDALRKYVEDWKEQKQGSTANPTEVMTVGELVLRMGRKAEGINLLEVNSYLQSSKASCILFLIDWNYQIVPRLPRKSRITLKMAGRSLIISSGP
jgi:chromosome transmission fidelity protein 1